MSVDLNTFIAKVTALKEPTLFKESDEDILQQLDTLCIDFLEARSYIVLAKPKRKDFKSVDDLISYFYNLYNYYKKPVCRLVSNKTKDRAILNNFIKLRCTELSITFNEALAETAFIMEGLFMYEKDLGLTGAISLSLFGNKNCKWITDKIICLLNNDQNLLREHAAYMKALTWSSKEASSYSGFGILNIDTENKNGKKNK
jgi:hypothetical protein